MPVLIGWHGFPQIVQSLSVLSVGVISDPDRPDQNCLEIRYKISPGCDNFEPTRQPIHPALS